MRASSTSIALLAAGWLIAGSFAVHAEAGTDEAPTTTPSTHIRRQRDVDIATAVSHALADDARVHAMNVKVAVRDGVVTLTGRANNADEQRAAESVVRSVAGVRDVENRLVVAEPGAPKPGTSMIPDVPSHR